MQQYILISLSYSHLQGKSDKMSNNQICAWDMTTYLIIIGIANFSEGVFWLFD